MTREEAEDYAKDMTYRDAVYNALQGKCIPYRKATIAKLYELLGIIDNNSDRAEVQAYFAGQTYGWEEGRKALLDDVKAEIEQMPSELTDDGKRMIRRGSVFRIIDKYKRQKVRKNESKPTNQIQE